MKLTTKRCVASLSALAMACTLSVAAVSGVTTVAFAANTRAADANNTKAPWDDVQAKGSITIHKKDSADKQKGVAGAEFSIQKVKSIKGQAVTLSTKDGWVDLAKKVKDLNNGTIKESDLTLETAKTQTTADSGDAKFSDIEIGLYLVKETKVPNGYTSDVAPFFMTVPEITREKTATNNTYTYDVSVEPKNTNVKNNVTKTAQTGEIAGAGDTLPYVISAKVNVPTEAQTGKMSKDNIKGFAIFDDALTAAYESVGAETITEVKIKNDTQAMAKETDYKVSSTATPNDATRTRIMVTFTETGLEKIADKMNKNNNDVSVEVTVKLKLKSDLSQIGAGTKLDNKSGFIPGHGKNVPDTPTPGGTAETEFRKFQIFKYDGTSADNAKTPLQGAKFKVFANKAKAETCAKEPSETSCSAAMTGFGEQASDQNGLTQEYTAKVGSEFYVVETTAPEKFVRSAQVYTVNVTSSQDKNSVFKLEIANIPVKGHDNWFMLPKTGAAGVVIFAIAGLALVCAGSFIYMSNRKKDEKTR